MHSVHRPQGTVGGSVPQLGRSLLAPALAVLLSLTANGVVHAEDGASGSSSATDEEAGYAVSESLTVTDTRLRSVPQELEEVPAHVTVIGGAAIDESGADTLQELLELEAGMVLFDQVGDGVSRTLDLRGFSGSGTRVYLDGAPLNDVRNNSLALELVPPAALERVEILRGSAAALAGGGSEAGVIQLFTRRGGPASGRLSLAAGDFGTLDANGRFGGRLGGLDLFGSGSYWETDGFRENADGELTRLSLGGGRALGEDRRLELSWLVSSGDFGNPGALTLEELAADPGQAPFNSLDFSGREQSQATASYSDLLGRRWALRANLFLRDADSRILTTGRAAPVFGGFHAETDASVAGSAVQLTWEGGGSTDRRLDVGVDWLDGATDAVGIPTPPGDPGRVDAAAASSDNTADRETLALFAQAGWRPAPAWSLSAGARWDDDRVGYRERLPDPANVDSRGFSELSLRAGATWSAAAGHDLYATLSDGFLPPTPEDLFSFPLFGSNPELEPEDSRSLELGYRGRWLRGRSLTAALFQIDTADEIVFDPDSPLGLFGANVNQGEARRRGLELSMRGPLGERLRGFANLTLMDAELRSGSNAGAELPLVPDERLAVGLDADLPAGLGLRLTALHVGEQVLDNDEANAVQRLDGYQVIDLRLSWRSGPGGGDGLVLFVEARNLFDESYASRGIFAFDFSTFTEAVFLTPAPGRRIMGGAEWSF